MIMPPTHRGTVADSTHGLCKALENGVVQSEARSVQRRGCQGEQACEWRGLHEYLMGSLAEPASCTTASSKSCSDRPGQVTRRAVTTRKHLTFCHLESNAYAITTIVYGQSWMRDTKRQRAKRRKDERVDGPKVLASVILSTEYGRVAGYTGDSGRRHIQKGSKYLHFPSWQGKRVPFWHRQSGPSINLRQVIRFGGMICGYARQGSPRRGRYYLLGFVTTRRRRRRRVHVCCKSGTKMQARCTYTAMLASILEVGANIPLVLRYYGSTFSPSLGLLEGIITLKLSCMALEARNRGSRQKRHV
ncbi:hypothetical protein GGR55DRAFT_55770 [Xylaria sp. FL0064]|nr:hypothetical protein GGR55DRAFT_55770 [Xylaria sp. FL0064]